MDLRSKRVVIIVGLAVAALFVAYFGLRSSGGAPDLARPAAAVHASDIHMEESATAAAGVTPPPPTEPVGEPGNADAAFQSLRVCVNASRELARTIALSDCSEYEGQPQLQELYAQCLNGWMNVPKRKAAAEAALKDAGCGDTNDAERRYFEATKQAARNGNAEAQICYLNGDFGASSEDPLLTAADMEEYKRLAPRYVDAAIRRGDWRIVQLMTRRSFHPGVGPITHIPGIGKPETIYKMTRLLRLGASGSYARILDSQLRGMIHPDLVPEAALPDDVVERGNAWAQQTFNEYFSGVPGLTERPTVCMDPLGTIEKFPGSTSP